MKTLEKTQKTRGRPAGQSRSEIQVVGYLRRSALVEQLQALVAAGTIGHFWAVEHGPDEENHKQHWHLRMTPPPSRAVVWAEVLDRVQEHVPGEGLPRRLVAGKRAVNDASLDGLLYARHDSRFLARKGKTKEVYDYPREAFVTDSPEWLDQLWAESDNYTPAPHRSTMEELLALVERNPRVPRVELLRTCLLSGVNKGQFEMLEEYRRACLYEQSRRERMNPAPAPASDNLPDETPDLFDLKIDLDNPDPNEP